MAHSNDVQRAFDSGLTVEQLRALDEVAMMWVQTGPIVIGVRLPDWSGDTDANGEPMPPGTMAAISFDTHARAGKLWAYDPDRGDTLVLFKFSDFDYEPGTRERLYEGVFNPMGKPSLFYHGGMLKFIVPAWPGPSASTAPLLRGYTNVHWR